MRRSLCSTRSAPSISGETRDSLIQIHLPPLSAARTKTLHDGVRAIARRTFASASRIIRRCAAVCSTAPSELQRADTNAAREDVNEAVELLRWLAADRFTFLGARDYEYARRRAGRDQAR